MLRRRYQDLGQHKGEDCERACPGIDADGSQAATASLEGSESQGSRTHRPALFEGLGRHKIKWLTPTGIPATIGGVVAQVVAHICGEGGWCTAACHQSNPTTWIAAGGGSYQPAVGHWS